MCFASSEFLEGRPVLGFCLVKKPAKIFTLF